MSGGLEQRLTRAWYQGSRWLILLRPLSLLFGWLARRRRQRYLADPQRVWQPPVPLIVVGNITVGGTGKTPMVVWLVDYLQQRGLRPGVISRGYGGKPPQLPWRVDAQRDSAERCGDEPLLVARRCGVPVVVDPQRVRAARFLLEQQPVDVLISDDGLQHYALGRSLEIVMLDHQRGLGNRRCLPEGPLREPPQRLQESVLCVRTGAMQDSADGFAMPLRARLLVNLQTGEQRELVSWDQSEVVALAGIGNPQRFFDSLIAAGLHPECHAFADHARYDAALLDQLDNGRPLLMTEKDAVKCLAFARDNWWYLRIDGEPGAAFVAALEARLMLADVTPRPDSGEADGP